MPIFRDNFILTVFCLTLAGSFGLTVLLLRRLIPLLKSMKAGQKILDIGPRWHKSKEGTPTMGGLAFIAAMAVVFGICFAVDRFAFPLFARPQKLALTFCMALLSGGIGVVDDLAKLRHKRNEGLTSGQKFFLQVALAGLYLFCMRAAGCLSTALYLPYVDVWVELGLFYYIFALILIAGIMNSVNLSDGIDGLCASLSACVGGFFALAAALCAQSETVVLAGLCTGGCLGFLVYNFHPAKVFMGDTGSLFLGGLLAGMAFMLDNPLIIVVCGFVFIAETVSVMLQVTFFKLTHGKRLFKMAPIHHHFEKCGWSEVKIVAVFCLVTLLLCGLSFPGLAE